MTQHKHFIFMRDNVQKVCYHSKMINAYYFKKVIKIPYRDIFAQKDTQMTKNDPIGTQDEELKECVRSFFEDYLNMRECSDSGHMWAPIAVSCARAMKLEPLGNLLERMRILSGARKAPDEI